MEDFSDTLSVNDSKPTSYIALMLASSSKAEQLVDIGNDGGDGGGAASGNDSGASALSEQNSSLHNLGLTAQELNPRKRKGVSAKRSEADENDRKEKCSKVKGGTKEDGSKAKAKDSNSSDTAESCPNHAADTNKTSAPPKQDYIHVRARRGQATDSHSLAERVRREKISERMKILQDLVPGCNKITGKAVMLDEIINYVQALQRQVEFLSMKLAAVNPQPDFHVEGSYLTKDILAPHCTSAMFSPDKMIVPPQFQFPQKFPFDEGMPSKSEGHDEATVRRMMDGQFPCISNHLDPVFQSLQIPHVWENEIQNGVDSRIFHHGKSSPLTSHGGFQGLLSGHLKVEL